MATLEKPKLEYVSSQLPDAHVPTPFPVEQLVQLSSEVESSEVTIDEDEVTQVDNPFEDSAETEAKLNGTHSSSVTLQEVMPSIVHVQSSCLMTLSNLLFPSFALSSHLHQSAGPSSSTVALQTLVAHLQTHPAFQGQMIQSVIPNGDLSKVAETELLRELKLRVEGISSAESMPQADLTLATALVNLLTNLNRLSEIYALGRISPSASAIPTPGSTDTAPKDVPPEIDVFSTLTKQLSDFQLERRFSSMSIPEASGSNSIGDPSRTPIIAVEESLLWTSIEGDLENVVKMCKERVVEAHPTQYPHLGLHQLPPEYNLEDYDDLHEIETLPDYDHTGRASFSYDEKDTKSVKGGKSTANASIMTTSTNGVSDEKMRMDLETVALAIDRLYAVAPQLHNQRVELKKDKVREMARASSSAYASGSRTTGGISKASKMLGEGMSDHEKQKDAKDFEKMMEMIGRASERSLKDQSVILDGERGMQKRLEKAKQKDDAKRDAFAEHLIRHSSAGRIHNQDVVLSHLRVKSTDRERDPEAMLSLPEFMREPLPSSQKHRLQVLDLQEDEDGDRSYEMSEDREDELELEREMDAEGEVMLTLPEFVKEPIPPSLKNYAKRRSAASGSSSARLDSEYDNGSEEGIGAPLSRTSSSGKDKEKEKFKKGKKKKSRSGSEEKGDKDRKRSRSLSAPPLRLSWLRSSPSSSGLAAAAAAAVGSTRHGRNDSNTEGKEKDKKGKMKNTAFDIAYVAEHHENLHHILTFFTINSNATPSGKKGSGASTPKSKLADLPGPVEVEVLPPLSSFISNPSSGFFSLSSPSPSTGEHFVIKSGPLVSLPLMLPAHTSPGKHTARQLGGHYEVKLNTSAPLSNGSDTRPSSSSSSSSGEIIGLGNRTFNQISSQRSSPSHAHPQQPEAGSSPLLDATQLLALKPTSFICASCSLPLIFSSKVDVYRDLPSEHWEELVEAWMCHADQKLSDQVKKFTGKGSVGGSNSAKAPSERRGFWPEKGQALVGGSYVLFEESAMNRGNLFIGSEIKHDEAWRLTRCICGALIGRCQQGDMESESTSVYRVLKYAIRPVSPGIEPLKIPLSAFVVEDMMEFVHAHATYRFVIRDEEEERPRILVGDNNSQGNFLTRFCSKVWLFKPRIRLAYTSPRHHTIPKSANIIAAKVLYKLLSPEEQQADLKGILNTYPGFPQAEHLSYPMSVCRHIAALLNDSNSAYPEALRQMTGLKVGWLQRT
ncbi:HECT-like ubiquitin-conjugating enzyme-binding-domain-containing protein [Crepidotus variabilis]|uniref:HECT-like ubiquitin-conjugating enzyme-binding-domain-containing protein n=1 Tax=Crepidotus variabilis TaxID=179855 RepID=A0A9P6JRZ3_9AGAR|nr:HECT-like ubiquitin-conjugating enzyme-binding-domain-containing protein [Crepidotus variabilis]